MTAVQELVDAALAASTADACIVIAAEHTEANLRWANNSLTTNGQRSRRSLSVVSIFDGDRAGVVSRSADTADDVLQVVRAADAVARTAEPAADAGPLVEPYEHDDDWSADAARTSFEVFEQFAPTLGKAFERCMRDDLLLFGFAEHQMTSYFLATSTGLRRRFDQPLGRLTVTGKSADLSRSAWSGSFTRDFTDLDVIEIADQLTRQLDWARTRIALPAGRYETILPPTAVADLMIFVYVTTSARGADEGRNVFASAAGGNRIGEQLSDEPLTLYSDPYARGLQCPPFDLHTGSQPGPYPAPQSIFDSGQPAIPARWIDTGRLNDLPRTRAYARQHAATSRPFVHNLLMSDGANGRTLDEMVANTERGLLLTSLFYIREVDPQKLSLTGLTRDGVYLVENGQVRGAVNNFRFNESPIDLLARLTEVGRTERTLPREWGGYLPRAAMPAIRVPDFFMSSVSQAW